MNEEMNIMNCYKKDSDRQDNAHDHKGRHMSHMLMMILCCGAPLLVLALLPLINRFIPGAANAVYLVVPLLCPLMMLPMLISSFKHEKDGHKQKSLQRSENSNADLESGN